MRTSTPRDAAGAAGAPSLQYNMSLAATPIGTSYGATDNKPTRSDIFSTRITMQPKSKNVCGNFGTSMTARIATLPRVSQVLEQALNIRRNGIDFNDLNYGIDQTLSPSMAQGYAFDFRDTLRFVYTVLLLYFCLSSQGFVASLVFD